MTKDEYLSLFPDDPHLLYVDPAKAAAETLAEFWSGMEPEGQAPRDLYNDVGEVIKILKEWRDNVLESIGAPFVENQLVINDYIYSEYCGKTACILAMKWYDNGDCMLKLEYSNGYVHWLGVHLVKPVKQVV